MADVIKEILIDRFDGGISDDPRAQVKNQFVVSSAFDIWSNPNRLTPNRSFEDDQDDGVTAATGMKQYGVRDFWPSFIDGRLYGLGNQASFSRPKIFYKTDPGGTNTWTLPASSEGSAGLIRGCFFEWAGSFWMFSGSTNVSSCIPGTSFTNTVASVGQTISSVAQGVISPTDNNAYMFYYATATRKSYVVKIDSSAAVTDNVLPLPTGYIVKSACLWGNYIAIGLTTGVSVFRSIVVLWDPTLSNFSEIIDFGDGEIRALDNVEGSIVAMMDGSMSTSLAINGGTLNIRVWGGGAVQTVKSIKNTTIISSGLFTQQKVVKDFRFYIAAQLRFNNGIYQGLWCFGRKTPGQPFSFTLAITDSNANTSNGINGFANMGDFWFLAENSDGSLRKTNEANNFSAYAETSFVESQKYNGGDIKRRKRLHSVFATTVPLGSSQQLVLKYRKDEETSYTTLFTETTSNNILTELGAAGGVDLPEFKEIQFKLESTGGAEITSWGFRFEELDGATTPDA